MSNESSDAALDQLGWREWVSLPDLGIDWVEAKVDTGAYSSALHASDIETFDRDGRRWVRFKAVPWRRTDEGVTVESPLADEREVRSSNGEAELRPVIATTLTATGSSYPIELNLTDRSRMNFRMLLGREALQKRFVVNTARSHCGGKPPRAVRARGGKP